MHSGSVELTRSATAYVVCLVFAMTFLMTVALGAGTLTAVTRGIIAAVFARLCCPPLMRPVVSTVFDAMARDRVEQGGAPEDESR